MCVTVWIRYVLLFFMLFIILSHYERSLDDTPSSHETYISFKNEILPFQIVVNKVTIIIFLILFNYLKKKEFFTYNKMFNLSFVSIYIYN